MNEDFLSFLWKYSGHELSGFSWEGDNIKVLSPGELNTNAGPDYFNARIIIGDTQWVGNVEIHVNSSDWNRHNHDKNAAFDNVILQVVHKYDSDVYNSKGRKIVTIELSSNNELWDNYSNLINENSWIACEKVLSGIDRFVVFSFINSAGIESLSQKTDWLAGQIEITKNDWEEIFFRKLARSFGFHINAEPFELLARNTSYKILKKHVYNDKELESLLFGQAGFLFDDYCQDEYVKQLKKEYDFIKEKYSLRPIDVHLWKFLRLRPMNFPTLRIAQLAALLYNNKQLLSNILNATSISELHQILINNPSEYWDYHYSFGNISSKQMRNLGIQSANSIIINTIIPFYFIYGIKTGNESLKEKAIQFLEKIPPEKNNQIYKWENLGITPKNAFDTQALLYIKKAYCEKKKCLECKIGSKLILSQLENSGKTEFI